MTRRVQVALLALLAAGLTAAPSAAGKSGLTLTEAGNPPFPDRAFVLTLPSDRPLSADQLRVRENGTPVTGLTVVPAALGKGNQFGVVLVIDASDSMKGKPIAGALAAAQLFVGHRTAEEQVAVVTFNDQPDVALPFTTDSSAILQALAHKPTLAYGTHIYDAVGKAISLLEQAKIVAGSVVVLSDGADTGSTSSRADVIAAAKRAHVRIFAVGLRSKHFEPGALRKLAQGASGSMSEAESVKDLSRIYDQLGTQLSREYLLRYRSYRRLGEKVQVSVQIKGVAGAGRSGYATPPLTTASLQGYHKGFGNGFWGSPFTMIVVSVFAVGLVAFCLFLLLMPRRRTFQKRLAEFVSMAEASDGGSIGGALQTGFLNTTEKSLEGAKWWGRFVEEVELAEIRMKPAYIAIWTLIGTVLVMWLLAVFFTFAGLLLGLIVPFTVWGIIRRKVEHKRQQFAEQLAGQSCRPRLGDPGRAQLRGRAFGRRGRCAGTRAKRVSAGGRRRAARTPARGCARGGRRADAEPRPRAGCSRRHLAARDRRQHGRSARARGRNGARAYGAAPPRTDAHGCRADVPLGRLVSAARPAPGHLGPQSELPAPADVTNVGPHPARLRGAARDLWLARDQAHREHQGLRGQP